MYMQAKYHTTLSDVCLSFSLSLQRFGIVLIHENVPWQLTQTATFLTKPTPFLTAAFALLKSMFMMPSPINNELQTFYKILLITSALIKLSR